MGEQNSSITRVRPFFRKLLARDGTGLTWLPQLLRLAGRKSPYAETLAERPGRLLAHLLSKRCYSDRSMKAKYMLEECFEHCAPPPERFLRWLILHPERMRQPTPTELAAASPETRTWRSKLFGAEPDVTEAQDEALKRLAYKGVDGSDGCWWAFEGETEVDCFIETESLVLLVEGKRNEPLSSATKWFPERNQLWRNVEVAASTARGKRYAVLLMTERPEDPSSRLTPSFPHLDSHECSFIGDHYLGCISWMEACGVTGIEYSSLPNTVADAAPEQPCRETAL